MDHDALFALLNDATRRRMLRLLLAEGALCVCELCAALEADQPKVSRHLARMREAGLVEDRRAAQWIVYRVPEHLPGALAALLTAADLMAAPEAPDADRARLASMTARPPPAARAA
jgi:ArsR family transcriptional regulator